MEAKEVEKLVSGTFKGTSLVPVWEHAGNRHYFRFRDLEKSDKEEVLQLNFKKEVSNEKTVRIPIPGKNIFNVLNIEISDSSPAVISIYMSENIDPEQDLKGLVNIPGITLDNFKIDQNVIRAYLPSSSSMKTGELNLYPGIRSITGNTLQNTYTTSLQLQSLKPEVEFIGKGVIVPDKNQVLVPFSAVGLKAVDLEIIQVSPQNMNFFLQENTYDGYGDLVRTARPVFMKKIDLLEKNPTSTALCSNSKNHIPHWTVRTNFPTPITGQQTGTTQMAMPITTNTAILPATNGANETTPQACPITPANALPSATS